MERRKKGRYRDTTGLVSPFIPTKTEFVYFDPFTTFLEFYPLRHEKKKISYSFSAPEHPRFLHIIVHVANDVWVGNKRGCLSLEVTYYPGPASHPEGWSWISEWLSRTLDHLWPISVLRQSSWEVRPELTLPFFSSCHFHHSPPENLQMNHQFCITSHHSAFLLSLNIIKSLLL